MKPDAAHSTIFRHAFSPYDYRITTLDPISWQTRTATTESGLSLVPMKS
jgi:hypothetical protein